MIYTFDAALTRWINSWAGLIPILDATFIWISMAGIPLLVIAVAGQWWLPQNRARTRHVLLAGGFSFVLGLAINQIILLMIGRVRPYDAGITNLIIEHSNDPSFPSDHATAGLAIAVAFLVSGLRGRGLGFLAAALLVATSRIYIGTHYVSDVVGGATTGVVAALIVRQTYLEGSRIDRILTSIL